MTLVPSPRPFLSVTAIGLIAVTLPDPALAAGSGMPWEAPLQSILEFD